jgi:glycosyltransferase involved in cell wall biosynthesis
VAPLVSVVIPCYLQANYLRECVRQLRQQTLFAWEAIIVNDGSPDDTEVVARSLMAADARLRYVSKANGGLSSARNAGLRAATGQFIQFLDADDWLDPRKLETQTACLQTCPKVDIAFGNAWYFREAEPGRFMRGGYAPPWRRNQNWIRDRAMIATPMVEKLLANNQFPVCSALVRKTLFDRVGGFNEELKRLEDWEFWIRGAVAGATFEYVDAADSDARIRMHSSTMTADVWQMREAELTLARAVLQYLPVKLIERAMRLAAGGIEAAASKTEWQEQYDSLYRQVSDRAAQRWLERYALTCGFLPLRSIARRIALRIVRRFG